MNSDVGVGFIFGMVFSWVIALIVVGVEKSNEANIFEIDCKTRGGVVMKMEGERVCLPATLLDMKL